MTTIFLKLGGSLITDKSRAETERPEVIMRLSRETSEALRNHPDLRLVVGHGSGSYGHFAAKKYSTHLGVKTDKEWRGFADVAVTAARLNHRVMTTFADAGVPIIRFQPSASAICEDGKLVEFDHRQIELALDHGLVPLIHGDVAFDRVRGGTIISTETVMSSIARHTAPDYLLLAGDYDGVLDAQGNLISEITSSTLSSLESTLAGSENPDVTGGMLSKVTSMMALAAQFSGLEILIFSGEKPGSIYSALTDPKGSTGTWIRG